MPRKSVSRPGKSVPRPAQPLAAFNLHTFLDSAGIERKISKDRRSAVVFSQGDPATDVYYVQRAASSCSVLSRTGKEAVVAMLGPGDFFGEGSLAGQPIRMATATAISASTVLIIEKQQMVEVLHKEPAFRTGSSPTCWRGNIRIEEDLVDQLFNSSEKRLARTLLLLARYGKEGQPLRCPRSPRRRWPK